MKQTNNSYLLKVEAVNIYATLEDTRQLSVLRGGSMLLRKAIQEIPNIPELKDFVSNWKNISTGASAGLFQFISDSLKSAEDAKEEVVKFLTKPQSRYKYFSFVVAIIQYKSGDEDASFEHSNEALLAVNRFTQFQQPTISCDIPNTDTTVKVCAWNNILPAKDISEMVRRDNGVSLANASEFVNKRHEYGRNQKRYFIKEEAIKEEPSADFDHKYSNDLHELTNNPDFMHLSNKMAVLYFDGNKFGSIQRLCKSPESLERFDENIQKKRRLFLQELVNKASKEEDFLFDFHGEKRIRLELLLWGGDEIMLAVPAWKGMEVLQLFYTISEKWKSQDDTGRESPLTHAGGLVFCHNKTPISRIQQLSKEIADYIKEKNPGKQNLYNYLVLESVDYPTQPYYHYIKKQYGKHTADVWQPQIPLYGSWDEKQKLFLSLLDGTDVSRRQVYKLVEAAVSSMEKFDRQYIRFQQVMGGEGQQIKDMVESLFPIPIPSSKQRHLPWMHLLELWDYFVPQKKASQEGNE